MSIEQELEILICKLELLMTKGPKYLIPLNVRLVVKVVRHEADTASICEDEALVENCPTNGPSLTETVQENEVQETAVLETEDQLNNVGSSSQKRMVRIINIMTKDVYGEVIYIAKFISNKQNGYGNNNISLRSDDEVIETETGVKK